MTVKQKNELETATIEFCLHKCPHSTCKRGYCVELGKFAQETKDKILGGEEYETK